MSAQEAAAVPALALDGALYRRLLRRARYLGPAGLHEPEDLVHDALVSVLAAGQKFLDCGTYASATMANGRRDRVRRWEMERRNLRLAELLEYRPLWCSPIADPEMSAMLRETVGMIERLGAAKRDAIARAVLTDDHQGGNARASLCKGRKLLRKWEL